MSHRSTTYAVVLCALLAAPAAAQAPVARGVVSGTVQATDGAPVPAAMVALRRAADTVVVAGSTTDSTGSFRLTGVGPGRYSVEIRRIGFTMATRGGVTITAAADRVDVGVVRLQPSAVALEGVMTTAEQPAVTVLPDRNVYTTRDMPAAVGGTATDVLRSIPGLEVSVEGTVTTRGATPQIHINGRPAPMQGEALDRYLQQLPAERIERVEVVANPSARYEAEGQGGIVNIVMKRGGGVGVSGSVSANVSTRNQRGGSGSINLQKGRLSVFGSASANFFGNDSENSDLRENLTALAPSFIQQDSRNTSSGDFADVSLAAELRTGENGIVWADAGAGRNPSDISALTAYTHLDELRNPTERYDRLMETSRVGRFGSIAAGYRVGDLTAGGLWSVEIRRTFNAFNNTNEAARYPLTLDGAPLDAAPALTFAGQGQDQSGLSLEANLTQQWGETGQLEIGYRGSVRETGDDFRTWGDTADGLGAAEERVGDFRQRERIDAGFVSLTQQVGRFHVRVGVRGELAQTRRSLPLSNESFASYYRNLLPNALVSTEVGTTGQLTLAYSKRVDRPWGGVLNPAIPNLDPLNRRIGNPYLMPRYSHSLTLTATRTGGLGMVQVSPYYRRTSNSWDQVRTVDEAGVSTVTWQNVATISSYGASLAASLTPIGRVSGFLNVSAHREIRDATNLRADFSRSSTQISVVGSGSVRATPNLSVEGSLTYLPARTVPQGRISPMVFSSVGMRHRLWGRRGSIGLSVTDPFELQRFTFTTRDRTHVQIGSSSFSARRASLGISYSFGRHPQRSRRGEGDGEQQSQAPVIR